MGPAVSGAAMLSPEGRLYVDTPPPARTRDRKPADRGGRVLLCQLGIRAHCSRDAQRGARHAGVKGRPGAVRHYLGF